MSITLEYVSRLGRVKRVSVIMLADRGYELPKQEAELASMNDLSVGAQYLKIAKEAKCSFGYSLSGTYARGDDSLLVLFLDNNYDEGKKREKMVSTEQAKVAIALWKNSFADCAKCMLICPGKLSPDAKKEVNMPDLTILTHEFLLLPVGRHILVPRHTALTETDAQIFLQHRKLKREQLPQLKVTDPVSLYYGYAPGTIVKIDRPAWTIFRVVTA